MAVIYCFGDSITYGAWDIERGGWANRLRAHLDDIQLKDDSKYYLCYNLGIPGDDTSGLAERFEFEMSQRKKRDKGEEVVYIFAFGSNDAFYMPGKNTYAVSKEAFQSNLKHVIEKAHTVSRKILFVNAIPCDEALCAKRYAGKDKERLSVHIEAYNELLSEIGRTYSIPVIDAYSAFTKNDFNTLMSEDGLHPNEKGHQVIFEAVLKVLKLLL